MANITTILSVASVLWLGSGAPLTYAQSAFIRGDGNSDGARNIGDTTFILNSLFTNDGAQPTCLDAGDANDDGDLDASDPIYLLLHLFAGGPPPPLPGFPCGGTDPTDDGLGCEDSGVTSSNLQPTVEVFATFAPAPGVRERTRVTLPSGSGGVFEVDEGTSFAILVVGESFPDFVSPARIDLSDPNNPNQGNPQTLRVTTNQDLGNPTSGGVAAGENLAPLFLNDLDLWSDPIYLVEHAALRVAGDGPLAPSPGLYEFSVQVTDEECATSEPVTMTLEVLSSSAPDLFVWTEGNEDFADSPRPHDPGSGNPRVDPTESFLLVVETQPNGRNPGPTPSSVLVLVDPLIGSSSEISMTSIGSGQFTSWLQPGPDFPGLGNTTLSISTPLTNVELTTPLEVDISFPNNIQPIWNLNCSGCHEAPAPFLDLEMVGPGILPSELWKNYVNIVAVQPTPLSLTLSPFRIRPYFPHQSYLYHKLMGTHEIPEVNGTGLRMPLGGPPYLDDTTIHLIESWILQGAQKD